MAFFSKIKLQKTPALFFLIGLMGSGKSYWGKLLAKKNNFNFVDVDKLIERKMNLSINEIFNNYGEPNFRKMESEILIELSLLKEHTFISTGGGTACFNNNINWMNENGITIWLNDDVETISKRLEFSKIQRPLLINNAENNLQEYLNELLKQRIPFYSKSKHQLLGEQINENNFQAIINSYV